MRPEPPVPRGTLDQPKSRWSPRFCRAANAQNVTSVHVHGPAPGGHQCGHSLEPVRAAHRHDAAHLHQRYPRLGGGGPCERYFSGFVAGSDAERQRLRERPHHGVPRRRDSGPDLKAPLNPSSVAHGARARAVGPPRVLMRILCLSGARIAGALGCGSGSTSPDSTVANVALTPAAVDTAILPRGDGAAQRGRQGPLGCSGSRRGDFLPVIGDGRGHGDPGGHRDRGRQRRRHHHRHRRHGERVPGGAGLSEARRRARSRATSSSSGGSPTEPGGSFRAAAGSASLPAWKRRATEDGAHGPRVDRLGPPS